MRIRRDSISFGFGTFLAAAALLLTGSYASPAQSQEGASPALDEIMVSARKRQERLIDTPVAATALPKVLLERYAITELSMLSTALPGVNIYRASGGGAGGNLEIRGIGRIASDYGAEQPVALVVDGFSFTRGHALNMAFFDVEGIEVLKGPQTLFFGKNSPAGVISIRTVTPGDEFEGHIRVGYEFRTEDPTVEFGVSIPVSDKLAIRVAGKGEFMQGGFLTFSGDPTAVRDLSPFETDALYPSVGPAKNKYPQQKQFVGRLTAVFTPSDNFDAIFKFAVSRNKQNDAGLSILYACADGPGSNPYLNTAFFGLVQDTGQTCADKLGKIKLERPTSQWPTAIHDANPTLGDRPNEYFQRTRNILATLEMTWDLGDIVLTSVSGFWDYDQDEYTNYDYTSFAVVSSLQGESGHSWTTELRAQTQYDGRVNFMLGVFYEDMQRDLDAPVQIFPLGPAPASPSTPTFYEGSFLTYHHFWDNSIESVSLFGEVIWDITDTIEFSAGVRYTEEDRSTTGTQLFSRLQEAFPALGIPAEFAPFAHTGSVANTGRKFDDISPEATLSWHPTDDMLVYVAYKTGYQAAGTSNPGTFANLLNFACPANPGSDIVGPNADGSCAFTPEAVNESLTFDGSDVEGFELGVKGQFFDGRLRADLTVWRYIYKGLQVAVFDPITTTFTIQNAAGASNKGVEGSFTFAATDQLELRGSFQYVEQAYKDYGNAQCYTGQNQVGAVNRPPELAALCITDPILGPIQDLSGEKYGGGPFQIKGGFTYERDMGNSDWLFSFSGDVIHKQKGKDFLRQPNTAQPSYTVVDLSARVYQSDGPWELALICSNCMNEKYVVFISNKPLAKTGDLLGAVALPRLITLQATYRFN